MEADEENDGANLIAALRAISIANTRKFVSDSNDKLLFDAVVEGSLDDVKTAINKGATPKICLGGALLYYLSLNQTDDVVRIAELLVDEYGLDINSTHPDAGTPLFSSIHNAKLARFYIDRGVDLNYKKDGNTFLYSVVQVGEINLLKYMLENGDIDLSAEQDNGIMLCKAMFMDEEVTRLVLPHLNYSKEERVQLLLQHVSYSQKAIAKKIPALYLKLMLLSENGLSGITRYNVNNYLSENHECYNFLLYCLDLRDFNPFGRLTLEKDSPKEFKECIFKTVQCRIDAIGTELPATNIEMAASLNQIDSMLGFFKLFTEFLLTKDSHQYKYTSQVFFDAVVDRKNSDKLVTLLKGFGAYSKVNHAQQKVSVAKRALVSSIAPQVEKPNSNNEAGRALLRWKRDKCTSLTKTLKSW